MGGINLYGFVGNDSVNKSDILGLQSYESIYQKESAGECPNDPCERGSLLVAFGRFYLKFQLLEALKNYAYGQPFGYENFYGIDALDDILRPYDSCHIQTVNFMSDGSLDEKYAKGYGLEVPDCWTCEMTGGTNLWRIPQDHFWIYCYATNSKGEVVDSVVLDYWAAGSQEEHKGYGAPKPDTNYHHTMVGSRPPCYPKSK
jgi:hypothetical protein